MHLRAMHMWMTVMTVTVLALGAEGSAAAQSTPARAVSGSDATPARVEQQSAAVGPQLQAARASLGGKAKNSDAGAAIDWNALANRQVAAGSPVPSGLSMPRSAGVPIPSTAGSADSVQPLRGNTTITPPTTAGAATRVVPVGDAPQADASTSAPAAHPETVIRGQVNPAARTCYENDPGSKSRPPGRLIILITLTPSGDVDSVTVASNTGLSAGVTSCISAAAHATKFAPPGTNAATVRAAFTFPVQEAQPSREKTGK